MEDKIRQECLEELYGILKSTDESIAYHEQKLEMLTQTKERTKYLINKLNEET
jgi:hypothetical protein